MDAGINGDAQRIEQMVWMLFLKVYDAKEDDWELNEDNYVSIIPEECRWRNWAKADEKGRALTGDDLLDFVNNTLFPTLKKLNVSSETPVKKAIVKSTFEDANNYMKDGVHLRQVIDIIDEIEFDDVKESHAFGFVYEEILRELQSAGSSGEFYTPRAVTDFIRTYPALPSPTCNMPTAYLQRPKARHSLPPPTYRRLPTATDSDRQNTFSVRRILSFICYCGVFHSISAREIITAG